MKTQTEQEAKFRLEEFIEELPCDCPEALFDPNLLITCDRCLALKIHRRDQEIIERLQFQQGAILGALIAAGHSGAEAFFRETIAKAEARHV